MLPAVGNPASEPTGKGPGLLTVSGAVGKTNLGPVDPTLDQLFARHTVKFDKAYLFDAEALRRLPAVQIRPTLEFDARMHSLALGGLGPQWAIYDADTLAAFKDKPLRTRFALCPWGLFSIEVTGT